MSAPSQGEAPGGDVAGGAGPWWVWEARARPGRLGELLAAVLAALPAQAMVLASPEQDRVVALAPASVSVPSPPGGLLDRPAGSWRFDRVR